MYIFMFYYIFIYKNVIKHKKGRKTDVKNIKSKTPKKQLKKDNFKLCLKGYNFKLCLKG